MQTKTILIDKNLGVFTGSLNGVAIFSSYPQLERFGLYRIIGFDRERAEQLAADMKEANSVLELTCVDIENFRFYEAYNGWYIDCRELAKQGYGEYVMNLIQNIPGFDMTVMH